MKVAIVTTVRDGDPYLDSFIDYHLAIGFFLLILFFDDPDDLSADKYLHRQGILVVRRTKMLEERWRLLDQFRQYGQFIHTEVMARQVLNARIALAIASDLHIDWLLHIDIDELFFSPEQSVKDHFTGLSLNNVDVMTYHNHEAVAEQMEIADVFREVKVFKKNPAILSPEQKRLIDEYEKAPNHYFYFYINGKSSARVESGPIPDSVHGFCFKRSKLDLLRPWMRKRTFSHAGLFPCILHYSCCGFDCFWRKYNVLGPFADKWFGQGKEIKDILPLHIASRNACNTMDVGEAMAFYRSNFLENQLRYLDTFKREGICFEWSVPLH